MMGKLCVALDPYQSSKNTYISILKNNIPDDIEIVPLPLLKELVGGQCAFQIAHVNWYENIDGRSFKECLTAFSKKMLKLAFLKMKGVKIIATLHNRFPHDCRCPGLTRTLIKSLVKKADYITVLCDESHNAVREMIGSSRYEQVRSKIVKIAHPNYIGVYSDSGADIRKLHNIDKDDFVVMFFGAVKPYKNVELVLEAARRFEDRDNIKFFIVGGASNPDYKKEIEAKVKESGNVTAVLEFVPDCELVSMIKASDVLFLPYSVKSSLNSGTCILAFSLGKNVVCPEIGTISELNNAEAYSYSYGDDAEHLTAAIDAIQRVYTEYTEDHEEFVRKQEALLSEVVAFNSPAEIGKEYGKLYRDALLKKRQ